ncbi:hypothetical protein H0H92_014214 [Tricholoma furcatifolium]|nr:hypothetical protein H0H92_014214 [Tricholoma furcatifolium]
MYRVFLGAPTLADLDNDPSLYQWQTISSKEAIPPKRTLAATQSVIFPSATLEAASRRISRIYENVIFDEKSTDGNLDETTDGNAEGAPFKLYYDAHIQLKTFHEGQQTTMISWAPTGEQTDARYNESGPSFLLDISKSRSMYTTQFETQETQSYNYSDTSSIANFPAFNFSLNALTSLTSLIQSSPQGSRKVNVLLAVLEADGPDTIRIKKGPDAGKEVSVLSLILGDEDGAVCKLTAWREVADEWGGAGNSPSAKRGDILFIENVTACWDPSTSPTLTASPHLKSKMDICYRTMPYTHEDNRLRPDLRLGESDAAVRKVAAVVRWFERMAGLGGA